MKKPYLKPGDDSELGEVPALVFIPDKPTDAEKKALNKQAEQVEKAIDDQTDLPKE